MQLTHLGGEHTVTGSCHLLQVNGVHIMVDCGMSQGEDRVTPINMWPLTPAKVDYLFLTHAHIDHIGRVPELVQKGFRGEIITTHATRALMQPMLEDAISFTGMTKHEKQDCMRIVDDTSWGFEYNKYFDLKEGIRFKLGCAGHILGSCFIRFEYGDPLESIVFSGDLGPRNTPMLPDPEIPETCDLLILESTYGDRVHEDRRQRIKRLGEVLTRALSDGGKVFIPAFALGRAQELIYEIDRLCSDRDLRTQYPELECKSSIPVFLDSPLGLEITRIYSSLSDYWDKEARELFRQGDHPIDFDGLYAVETHRDHSRLLELEGPAIIIAGSGMCTGGRILDHLKDGIEISRNDIFFVGYQARGTHGREIIQHHKKPGGYVKIDGQKFKIKAKVHTLSGYSAHADQKELIEWVQSMVVKPGKIKLVHGEPKAKKALQQELSLLGYEC